MGANGGMPPVHFTEHHKLVLLLLAATTRSFLLGKFKKCCHAHQNQPFQNFTLIEFIGAFGTPFRLRRVALELVWLMAIE